MNDIPETVNRPCTERWMKAILFILCGLMSLGLSGPDAQAYIGPGAGFAVVSSFFVVFLTASLAFLTVLIWPFRAFRLYLKRRGIQKNRKAKRVIVLGLDGLDPELAERFMNDGILPNFKALAAKGSFRRLSTTCPAISPVAWATYATGVNPGKHRIFDFYTRDPNTYMPVLSSVRILKNKKFKRIGPIKVPFTGNATELLRKSTSFWQVLGERAVFSSVIRVPITFPPEKFYGNCLSAMCTPDIRGTQGSFTFLSGKANHESLEGGLESLIIPVQMNGSRFSCQIPGPPMNAREQSFLPINGHIKTHAEELVLNIGNKRVLLKKGVYSPWIQLQFKIGTRRRVSGITRFLATAISPEPEIYMAPINIDPERPSMPISHPMSYAISMSKLNGSFATLGLAEDTWALNERIIDEGAFLKQSYDIFEERKNQLFDTLKKHKNGFITIVFDTTDRIQHMFFRYLDRDHPANREKDTKQFSGSIQELYARMDALLGDLRKALDKEDMLMIISDHGFNQFKWGVNLNTWLWKKGYLVLKENGTPGALWFAGIDWGKTRAFAFGLAGIYLNIKGREKSGVIKRGSDRFALQKELKDSLEAMVDEDNQERPIRHVYLAQDVLKGPYVNDAPDLFMGYAPGYRASWNSAVGKITAEVIEENTKSWSGDHCIDPALAPGVFFSNWKMAEKDPSLTDMAPTILNLFGIEKQTYHDGRVLQMTPS